MVAATIAIYGTLTYAIVPAFALLFGRVRLPCGMSPVLGCLLNRTYVRSDLAALILELDEELAHSYPGTHVTILDANFPLFDGFPLLPHLSHDDGRKVDLAYFYREAATGALISAGAPSPIGYFHFERPRAGDPQPCARQVTPRRWNFAWLQPAQPAWVLDEERTRALILWWKARPETTRILVEPYLAERLDVGGGVVQFQGCQAARHDDHLHVQVK